MKILPSGAGVARLEFSLHAAIGEFTLITIFGIGTPRTLRYEHYADVSDQPALVQPVYPIDISLL